MRDTTPSKTSRERGPRAAAAVRARGMVTAEQSRKGAATA
ncbi:hypothetical protein GCM10025734_45460 [Kitasatospora paranensis]